jgi:hypothetical protein
MGDSEFEDPLVIMSNMTRSLRSKIQILRIDMQNIKHPMVYAYAENLLWKYQNDMFERLMFLNPPKKEGENNEQQE